MIATESFIWINYPKAASTFVRECLKTLYTAPSWNFRKKNLLKGRFMEELALPDIRAVGTSRYGSPTPHGLVRQIPSRYSHLPIVLSVRDPLERLLSLYHYGDWKKQESNRLELSDLRKQFPDFPNLTFAEFISFRKHNKPDRRLIIEKESVPVGSQSFALLNFVTPLDFVNTQGDLEFPNWTSFAKLINSYTFLKAACIDKQLFEYLLDHGFKHEDLRFIIRKGKVNVSGKSHVEIPSSVKDTLDGEWLLRLLNSPDEKVTARQLQEAQAESLHL